MLFSTVTHIFSHASICIPGSSILYLYNYLTQLIGTLSLTYSPFLLLGVRSGGVSAYLF